MCIDHSSILTFGKYPVTNIVVVHTVFVMPLTGILVSYILPYVGHLLHIEKVILDRNCISY